MKKLFAITFSFLLLLPSLSVISTNNQDNNFAKASIIDPKKGDGKTEYWALLIGVDYTQAWALDFNAERMNIVLPVSDHWNKENIKILTNENATKVNIINAFNWLDKMEDGDDICFIFYSSHGGYFNEDYFPFDEKGGEDWYITTWELADDLYKNLTDLLDNLKFWRIKSFLRQRLLYNSYKIPDDLFHDMLDKLDSKGVAVVLDACYSGGMIDSEFEDLSGDNRKLLDKLNIFKGFSDRLKKDGRIIITSADEKNTSTTFTFAELFMTGLQGYADFIDNGGNADGVVSAEEAYIYASEKMLEIQNYNSNPLISDNFEGELPLTDKNLPPNRPSFINGSLVGKTNTTYIFNISPSADPENHKIKYGWDWNIEYFYSRGAEVDEWSSFDNFSMSHSWDEPGVYFIRVKSQDEYGSEMVYRWIDDNPWSKSWTTIIASDDENVDQFQTKFDDDICRVFSANSTHWLAQSFIPNESKLSKVKLYLDSQFWDSDSGNYSVYIRNNLTGNNLAETKKDIVGNDTNRGVWVEFDFEDIDITPGSKYFIIIKRNDEDNGKRDRLAWSMNNWEEGEDYYIYQLGNAYESKDSGITWEDLTPYGARNDDFCFITYG